MTTRNAVSTDKAPAPLEVFSQAIISGGMVYCSGGIGLDPHSWKLAEGGIQAETVTDLYSIYIIKPD
jgi:enamine deaminase RidA (YjgF/YER057c/UK114 family)